MLHLKQTVCILIISCICLINTKTTLAVNERDVANILPGKYHAYNQNHQNHQYHTKKLHAKGLLDITQQQQQQHQQHLQSPAKLLTSTTSSSSSSSTSQSQSMGRQENPIKNWFGVFNRNNSKPQANATAASANPAATNVAQDTIYSTTCSCR